jgi:hypothetical protein
MHRLIIVVATVFLHIACVSADDGAAHSLATEATDMASTEDLGQIISSHSDLIMELEDVVGIAEGLCDGSPCIRVFLARHNATSLAQIQEYLAGIPFAIEISGNFTASPK